MKPLNPDRRKSLRIDLGPEDVSHLTIRAQPSGEDILLRNDRTLKTMYILTEQVLTLRESPVLRQRD